ncbi:MAG: glycosyltransferase family 39 protein [Spirochaetia bacterium]|nr:glycosyltransferase family 39 protein [Spirochaetia bacterium]
MGDFFRKNREILLLAVIILLAMDFRIMLLGIHRLHMDECLYSAYAVRMINHGDIVMNGGLFVDKPPLFFFAIAISFLVNGVSENAARLPNIIFSLLTVFFIYRLAKKMYGDDVTALLAAAFSGFSVIFTLFSTTAFQDISMTAFMVMSLYALKEGRHFRSALFYAFSIACKPMTIFILPLYAVMVVSETGLTGLKKEAMKYLRAFAWVFVPLTLWNGFLANPRWGMFKFFITQQPEAMKVSGNFPERFMIWLGYSEQLINGYVFLAIAAAGMLLLCLSGLVTRKKEPLKSDITIVLFIVYIYFIFSFLQFRQFDRYVVVLVPFVSIALARTIGAALSLLKNRNTAVLIAAVVTAVYALPMRGIQDSTLKMGAAFDHGDGFEKAAVFVRQSGGEKTQLIYFGDTISWYGYFYLADVKFGGNRSVYSLDELKKVEALFPGKNLVLVNAMDRKKEEVDILTNTHKLVYSSDGSGTGAEKYLVFEAPPQNR